MSVISVIIHRGYVEEQSHHYSGSILSSNPSNCIPVNNAHFKGYLVIDNYLGCIVAISEDYSPYLVGASNSSLTASIKHSFLIQTSFGYLSSRYLFQIDFEAKDMEYHPFNIQQALNKFNVSASDINTFDIDQNEGTLSIIYELKSKTITSDAKIFVIYAHTPSASQTHYTQRRLLAMINNRLEIDMPLRLDDEYISISSPILGTYDTNSESSDQLSIPEVPNCHQIVKLFRRLICRINQHAYEIQKPLGSGSHGSVYRAIQLYVILGATKLPECRD